MSTAVKEMHVFDAARDAGRACAVLTRHVDGCVAYTLENGALR